MAKRPKREQSAPGTQIPLEIVAVPPEGFLVARFLGDYRGILTHWGRKAALACPGAAACPTATHRGKTVWKGYAAAEYWRDRPWEDWCPCIIEITERCAEQMQGHLLRAQVWKLERGTGRNGTKEVMAEHIDDVNGDRLRKEFSIEAAVWRVYRTRDIEFDVDPYLPPRMLLTASAGDRPKICPDPEAAKKAPKEPYIPFSERLRLNRLKEQEQGGEEKTERGPLPSSPPPLPPFSSNGKH